MRISLINKKFIHLTNNIFWNMGFKNETQAEKVIVIIRIIPIIYIIRIICIILIISIMSQVHVELGIADHAWQEKRAAIAATIDALGDIQGRSACWMARVHPRDLSRWACCASCHSGRGDFGAWRLSPWCSWFVCSLIPKDECADWQVFCNEYAPKSHFLFLK